MSKIEQAIQWMEMLARDDSHGYDQIYRWGEKGDYDCSSAVITAYQNAGVPVKTNGATYTGNMFNAFIKSGFKDVTSSINLNNGSGLVRGDVLLNTVHHTAMYCGNGKEVEASINEKGTAKYGKPGDQTGREILIRNYRNYPWNKVLRYVGDNTSSTDKSLAQVAYEVIQGKWGNGADRVTALTNAGYNADAVQTEVNKLLKGESKPVPKPTPKPVETPMFSVGGTYTLQTALRVRAGAGTNYRAKGHSELTPDGRKHDREGDGCLDKGTRITALEVKKVGNDVWIKCPSGWVAGYYNGNRYIK